MATRQLLFCLQEAMPLSMKGLHFLNVGPVVDKILLMIKPFLDIQFWKTFELHPSIDSLHKFIEPEIFPRNYAGGMAPAMKELSGKPTGLPTF